MLAAHEPASAGSGAAAEVDVLVGIGGYHDADAVATWFTTGWYRLPLSVPPDPDAPQRKRRKSLLLENLILQKDTISIKMLLLKFLMSLKIGKLILLEMKVEVDL